MSVSRAFEVEPTPRGGMAAAGARVANRAGAGDPGRWLISRRFDLWMFGAPAAVALLLVPLGPWLAPTGETPFPMWLVAVLGIDVAHVWATLFRTYLDPVERVRRRQLLVVAPILAFGGGAVLAHVSLALFWTVLAYLAVFHFVRQQYGWVALHHRQDPDLGGLDRWLDLLTIYASTLYPLLWWHALLPRSYVWFLPGDFVSGAVPAAVTDALFWPYLGVLVGWGLWQLHRARVGRPARPGKALVVVGTALCWGVGIIATDTDWAFTVTNVIIHGVPYFGLVWVTARERAPGGPVGWVLGRAWAFYGVLLALAWLEELGWDRTVWGSGGPGFGPPVDLDPRWIPWATALFAVPQIAHYVLDGYIWRRKTSAPPNGWGGQTRR